MSWLSSVFRGRNPADSAMPYIDRISSESNQYLQPYYNAGTSALPKLGSQYDTLLGSPGGKLNEIGQDFQQSPGFKFALQQALEGAGHAAAAGGMAGSPQHEQQNMQLATDLGNKDYNNWIRNAMGLYGAGLEGEQGLAQGGLNAGGRMADIRAQQLAQQGAYNYQGQAGQNQARSSMLGNIGRGIGALSAFTPFGAAGQAFSHILGGGR